MSGQWVRRLATLAVVTFAAVTWLVVLGGVESVTTLALWSPLLPPGVSAGMTRVVSGLCLGLASMLPMMLFSRMASLRWAAIVCAFSLCALTAAEVAFGTYIVMSSGSAASAAPFAVLIGRLIGLGVVILPLGRREPAESSAVGAV